MTLQLHFLFWFWALEKLEFGFLCYQRKESPATKREWPMENSHCKLRHSSLVLWCVMGAKRISNGGTTKMFWRYLKIRGLVITSDQDCMRYLPCHNVLIYYTGGGCGHWILNHECRQFLLTPGLTSEPICHSSGLNLIIIPVIIIYGMWNNLIGFNLFPFMVTQATKGTN